ncbi:MAG: AfsR/SARP family transcriptional regulator, partial [Dermatophilaceae bacterium]
MTLSVQVLGPLCIREGADELDIGAPKQRAVLAALVFRAGQTVTHEWLVDSVWGDDPPTTARGSVHTYVSGLRRVLGHDVVRSSSAGYAVRPEALIVDEDILGQLSSEADDARLAGQDSRAIALLDQALSLWTGDEALANVPGPFADEQRSRLAAVRLRLLT